MCKDSASREKYKTKYLFLFQRRRLSWIFVIKEVQVERSTKQTSLFLSIWHISSSRFYLSGKEVVLPLLLPGCFS